MVAFAKVATRVRVLASHLPPPVFDRPWRRSMHSPAPVLDDSRAVVVVPRVGRLHAGQ